MFSQLPQIVSWVGYKEVALLEFQVFQTRFSNQKVLQSDKGSKNHLNFLGQVDFNMSNTTKMVLLTNPNVVFFLLVVKCDML